MKRDSSVSIAVGYTKLISFKKSESAVHRCYNLVSTFGSEVMASNLTGGVMSRQGLIFVFHF